jgi:hypothetical protein
MPAMSVATSRLPTAPGEMAQPPRLARRLGAAGLVPFVAGAVLVWLVYPEAQPLVTLALAGYAACVVAFLGGIHWGLAMRAGHEEPRHFAWGVVPPLVAAVGVLMPAYAGLVLLGAMLVVCYAVDRRLYVEQHMGAWLTLRFRLSAIAALSCFFGAAGS